MRFMAKYRKALGSSLVQESYDTEITLASVSSTLDSRLSTLPSLIFGESQQKVECLKSMRFLLLTSMK